MKRHKPPAHENHERWMVSYADLLTLLFALFVVMFATSQADKKKARVVSESVREALEHGKVSAAVSAVFGRGKPKPGQTPAAPSEQPPAAPAPPPAQTAELAHSLTALQQRLEQELKAGKVQVKLEGRGLVISLREAAFFASGDDAIAPASLPTIDKIAAVVRTTPNPIRVEGYTDAVPIHNSRFRSNWELSAARSIVVLEILKQQFGVPAGRMSVAGYAENSPAESNDTVEGRAHNRRVELVLLSADALKSEPRERSSAGYSRSNTTTARPK